VKRATRWCSTLLPAPTLSPATYTLATRPPWLLNCCATAGRGICAACRGGGGGRGGQGRVLPLPGCPASRPARLGVHLQRSRMLRRVHHPARTRGSAHATARACARTTAPAWHAVAAQAEAHMDRMCGGACGDQAHSTRVSALRRLPHTDQFKSQSAMQSSPSPTCSARTTAFPPGSVTMAMRWDSGKPQATLGFRMSGGERPGACTA